MNIVRTVFLAASLGAGGFFAMQTQTVPPAHVGPLADGGFLLDSGWVLRPAGTQVAVDTFPMTSALAADGKYLLVLNGGWNPPTLSVLDVATKKEISRTRVPDAWLGLAVSKTNAVYVGGGSKGKVYEFALDAATGALTGRREMAATQASPGVKDFIGDVAITPDAHILYAANLMSDSIAVINLQSGTLIDTWKCGRRPYRILVAPGERQIIVSSWADAALYQYDANSGKDLGKTRVGPHPTDLLWVNGPAPTESQETSSYKARLFVTAGNTNNVYTLGVTKDDQLTTLETINVSTSPLHPLGMTPSALGISKDAAKLFVVCSDANAVAVADITGPRAAVVGFIPTGWYPTAARVLPDGTLAILNGKGLGSRANPDGPNPTRREEPLYQGAPSAAPGYVPHIQTGTVAFLAMPSDEQLEKMTDTVRQNSPYRDELLYGPVTDAQQQFFSRTESHRSPIEHVIYIIKENRTYDQVLGDLGKGNGDAALTLFGEAVTPNLHQLARDFILYDNFYENADVSAEGHNWANAAIAPDYAVKTWPSNYAGRKKGYDYEGTEPANSPPAGYIWDNALQAGLTVRDYGEWTHNVDEKSAATTPQIGEIQDASLRSHVDMNFRGWDLEYPDVNRAHEFVREWAQFEVQGDAPQFSVVRLGNDHTEGTRANALTPAAYVADNDYAVGLLVEAVSHSKFWRSTAIFIIEDDAQNGPDHVDSHRAPAFVISPYTRRGLVDSTMYNQMSMLRTLELVLGLRPMTHFDAGATPMFSTFSREPDATPFSAIAPKRSTTERNPVHGPGSAESARMDFSEPDLVDDGLLTAVVWQAVKHTDAPPPTRSLFSH